MGGSGATLDIILDVSSFAERTSVTATKAGAADIQSTPIAITVLPARGRSSSSGSRGSKASPVSCRR